jgi:hypothetical protein
MADDLNFDQFIPQKNDAPNLDFDQFIPAAHEPVAETPAPAEIAPKPQRPVYDGMGTFTGYYEPDDEPAPTPVQSEDKGELSPIEKLQQSLKGTPPGVVAALPYLAQGIANVYNSPGGRASRAIGGWFGENVAPYTTEPLATGATRSFSEGLGSGAQGINVIALATGNEPPEAMQDFANSMKDKAKDDSLKAAVPNMADVHGAGDASKYVFNQFGNVLGGVASLLGVDIGVTAGATAATGNPVVGGAAGLATLYGLSTVQSIGGVYDTIMEDEGIKKLIKSGKLDQQDIARLSIPIGAVNGAITTVMAKAGGAPGAFTKNFASDIAKRIVKDPAIFFGGTLSQEAITSIATTWAGGSPIDSKKIADILNNAVNSAVGGFLFGGAKVGSRVQTRIEAKGRLGNQRQSEANDVQEVAQESAGQDVDAALQARVSKLFEGEPGSEQQPAASPPALTEAPVAAEPPKPNEATVTINPNETDPTIKAALDDLNGVVEKSAETTSAQPASPEIQGAIDELKKVEEAKKLLDDYQNSPVVPNISATELKAAEETIKNATPERIAQLEETIKSTTEPSPASAELPKDGSAVETPATFKAQVKDLEDGVRKAVLFPSTTKNADRPPVPDGMQQARLPNNDVVYYDRKQITYKELLQLYKENRLNEALNMADTSKVDAMERAARTGEEPTVLTVRDENGTPKVDALTTSETVTPDAQKIAAQTRPTDTIENRPLDAALQERAQGQEQPSAPSAPSVPPPTAAPAGAGPKAGPIVERIKSRSKPVDKPAEASKPAEVTPGVTPAPQGGRLLQVVKTPEEEAAAKRAEHKILQGGRGKQENAEPDAKNTAARLEFERRAKAAVKNATPENPAATFYQNAVDAIGNRTNGGNKKNNAAQTAKVMDAWRAEWEHVQNGGERFTTQNKTKGKVARAEEKAAQQQAQEEERAAREAAEQDKRQADSELDAYIAKDPDLKKLAQTDPERARDIAAVMTNKPREARESRTNYEVRDDTTGEQNGLYSDDYTFEQKLLEREAYDLVAKNLLDPEQVHQYVIGELTPEMEARINEGGKSRAERVKETEKQAAEVRAFYDKSVKRLSDAGDKRSELSNSRQEDVRQLLELHEMFYAPEGGYEKFRASLDKMSDQEFDKWFLNASQLDVVAAMVAKSDRLSPENLKQTVDRITGSVEYKETTTLRDIFKKNKASLRNEGLLGLLQKKLVDLVGDMKIHIVTDENMQKALFNDGRRENAKGVYRGVSNDILLHNDWYEPGTKDGRLLLLHEALHGAIARVIDRTPALKTQIRNLLDYVKSEYEKSPELQERYPRKEIDYAFTDEHELLSHTFGDETTQRLFSDMTIDPKTLRTLGIEASAPMRVFQAVAEWFRGIVKGPPNSRTALEQIVRLTDTALQIREERGVGAKYSQMTAAEKRLVREIQTERTNTPEIWLSKMRDPEATARAFLVSKGIDPTEAAKVSKLLVAAMGPNFKRAQLINKLTQYAALYAPAKQAPAPKSAVTPKGNPQMRKARKDYTEEGGKLDALRTALVDRKRPLEVQTEAAAERLGRGLTDEENIYEQSRLLGSKITNAIRKVEQNQKENILATVKEAKDIGMSFNDLGKALIARAASKRNERMQAEDTTLRSGSGMTDEEAARFLGDVVKDPKTGQVDPARKAVVDKVFELNDQIRREIHDLKIDSGEMSKKQSDELYKMEPEYTSLKGFEDEFTPKNKSGSGGLDASLASNGIGKAKGRETLSNNPLENMLQELVRAHQSALINKADQGYAKFIKDAGINSVAVHTNDAYIGKRAVEQGRVVEFYEDGKRRYLEFSDEKMADAWRRISPESKNALLSNANKVVNSIKRLWTHYSPEFLARHFLFRYPIEALVNLTSLKEQGVKVRPLDYIRKTFTDIPDVNRFLNGKEVKNKELEKWLNEAADAGGVVSYRGMTNPYDLKSAANRVSLERSTLSRVKDFDHAIHTFHTAMDLAERIQVYIRARQAGMTSQKAAMAMREATVDFEKAGSASQAINLWLPFGNVAINTSDRAIRAFASSKSYRRTVYGIIGASVAAGVANYLLGGDDADGTPNVEKIRSYETGQNALLMTGEGANGKAQYIKMPLPYNLFGPWAAGQAMAQSIMKSQDRSKLTAGEIAHRFMEGWLETLTPVGRNVANPGGLLAPAVVSPLIENYGNANAFGSPIHTNFPKKGVPKSEQSFDSTEDMYKSSAQALAKVGLDFYPEDIKHVVEHVAGTQIRLGKNINDTITGQPGNGREPSVNNTPMVRVVKGEVDSEQADKARLRTLSDKAAVDADTLKSLRAVANRGGNADDKAVAKQIESRTGMTAKQIVAVNEAAKQYKALQKKQRESDEENTSPKATAVRMKFFQNSLKKLNDLGISGGIN